MANLSTYQIKLNHFKQLNLVDLFSLENNFSIKMFSSLGTPRSWVLFKDKEPIVYLDFNYHQLLSPSEAQKSYNLNMSSSQPLLWLDSIYTSPDFRKNHYGFYLLFRLREYYQFPAMGLKLHPLEPAISYIKLKKAYAKIGFKILPYPSSKSKIMFSPANHFLNKTGLIKSSSNQSTNNNKNKPSKIKKVKTKL